MSILRASVPYDVGPVFTSAIWPLCMPLLPEEIQIRPFQKIFDMLSGSSWGCLGCIECPFSNSSLKFMARLVFSNMRLLAHRRTD